MKTLTEILRIIEDNQKKFNIEQTEFSYSTLKHKRSELISLGEKIGCLRDDFQAVFGSMETTAKYSHFNHSLCWGVHTPSPLDYYVLGKRKRIRKLYNKPLEDANMYYVYKYKNGQLVELSRYLNDKFVEKKVRYVEYFCHLNKSVYSIQFDEDNKYKVTICEAKFNDKNKIVSFSRIVTAGLPDNETDENIIKWCQRGANGALLDYQHFNYEKDKLISADSYTRIYDFSPQISGYEFGNRYMFVYDENNKIKSVECTGFKPCVFRG